MLRSHTTRVSKIHRLTLVLGELKSASGGCRAVKHSLRRHLEQSQQVSLVSFPRNH